MLKYKQKTKHKCLENILCFPITWRKNIFYRATLKCKKRTQIHIIYINLMPGGLILMISIKLARELKEAGLPWSPKVGDWFASILSPIWWLKRKKTGGEEIYLLTGQPTESGYYGWSMVDTEPFCELYTHDGNRQEETWEHLEKHFIWLPRLDQLVEELSRRKKTFKFVYETVNKDTDTVSGYWVSYLKEDPEKAEDNEIPLPEVYYSAKAEDSLGRALLSLLKEQKVEELPV